MPTTHNQIVTYNGFTCFLLKLFFHLHLWPPFLRCLFSFVTLLCQLKLPKIAQLSFTCFLSSPLTSFSCLTVGHPSKLFDSFHLMQPYYSKDVTNKIVVQSSPHIRVSIWHQLLLPFTFSTSWMYNKTWWNRRYLNNGLLTMKTTNYPKWHPWWDLCVAFVISWSHISQMALFVWKILAHLVLFLFQPSTFSFRNVSIVAS